MEQFDKIVEVQTDKASNEITSRFDGVIKKLHYDKDDVVQVGQALLDIDVQDDIAPEDEAAVSSEPEQAGRPSSPQQPQKAAEAHQENEKQTTSIATPDTSSAAGKHSTLATPAVRGLLKSLDIKITNIQGTGRDGRVTKEDVHAYAAARKAGAAATDTISPQPSPHHPSPTADFAQVETPTPLTPIQAAMYKTMSRSLSIPHFLYSDEVDITALSALRRRLNNNNNPSPNSTHPKLSSLPFIIKAVSQAIHSFPLLNARIAPHSPSQSTSSPTPPPHLLHRTAHNISIAISTPAGLIVPNIKSANHLSITAIALEIQRLQTLALAGKLSTRDLTGGTITVSNIGSIGGTVVSPVIVDSEVAILGVGRGRVVPAFDEKGDVVKKEVVNFSWAADHRVVDGATMARMAEMVRGFVEDPGAMMVGLR